MTGQANFAKFKGIAIDGPCVERELESDGPTLIIPIPGKDGYGQLYYYWRPPGYWSILATKAQ